MEKLSGQETYKLLTELARDAAEAISQGLESDPETKRKFFNRATDIKKRNLVELSPLPFMNMPSIDEGLRNQN